MHTPTCAQCHRPEDQAWLCPACTATLRRWLRELVGHAADLADVVLTRRTSHRGERVMVRSEREVPLPFDDGASEVAWVLHDTLVPIVTDLCESRGLTYPGVDTSAAMAAWLCRNVEAIALDPAALETYATVAHLAATGHDQDAGLPVGYVVRAVDVRPTPTLLGPCDGTYPVGEFGALRECGADVRADEDATTTRCGTCGTEHDVAELRARVLMRMRGSLATATEIARHLGGAVRPDTIGKWKRRGRLTSHGLTAAGADRYLVGDVLDLMQQTRQAARA